MGAPELDRASANGCGLRPQELFETGQ